MSLGLSKLNALLEQMHHGEPPITEEKKMTVGKIEFGPMNQGDSRPQLSPSLEYAKCVEALTPQPELTDRLLKALDTLSPDDLLCMMSFHRWVYSGAGMQLNMSLERTCKHCNRQEKR